MKTTSFNQLCWGASVELGLIDTVALSSAEDVFVDGVRFRAYHTQGQGAFLLVAFLGDVAPEDRASVSETLLAMQLAAWDDPLVRFGLHPLGEAFVLCVHVPLDASCNRVQLASRIRSIAAQVLEWREVQLAGKVGTFALDAVHFPPRADDASRAMHA